MSPVRAILLHSPGHKPWVNHGNTFIEPQRGDTTPTQVPNIQAVSIVPLERPPSVIIYPEERTRESHHLAIGYKNT